MMAGTGVVTLSCRGCGKGTAAALYSEAPWCPACRAKAEKRAFRRTTKAIGRPLCTVCGRHYCTAQDVCSRCRKKDGAAAAKRRLGECMVRLPDIERRIERLSARAESGLSLFPDRRAG